jgi:sulfite reductase alpha subunit-like flavoprotein
MIKKTKSTLARHDKVQIISIDKTLKDYLERVGEMKLNADYIRAICALSTNRIYKLSSICKSCKMAWVKSRGVEVLVRYNNLTKINS